MSITSPAPGLAEKFALILDGLRAAVAARMARPRTLRERLAAPLLMLLWSRLHRTLARFATLAARPVAPRRRTEASRKGRTPWPGRRLPRGLGWLIRLVPEAASYGSQLQHLLTDPAMADLRESTPQAARLLRPLCRMLAVPDAPETQPAAPGRAPVTWPRDTPAHASSPPSFAAAWPSRSVCNLP